MQIESSLFPSRHGRRAKKLAEPPPQTWQPLPVGAVVLCIDPSSVACGWAILRNTMPNPTRLDSGVFAPIDRPGRHKFDHLSGLIVDRLNRSTEAGDVVTHAIIETPAGGGGWGARSTMRLMSYSRSIGVVEATCYQANLTTYRATVTEWKQSGKKHRTQLTVEFFFKYTPRDDNEADALGLGLWLCSRNPRLAQMEKA